MTTLEIILITIIWIAYGIFNCKQHDWFKFKITNKPDYFECIVVIICAPIALIIRIFRGIFIHDLPYD